MDTGSIVVRIGCEGYREYFTRRVLTEERCEANHRGDLESSLSAIGSLFVNIPGVTIAFIQPYQVTIHKAPTYTWDEIEPTVMEILNGIEAT